MVQLTVEILIKFRLKVTKNFSWNNLVQMKQLMVDRNVKHFLSIVISNLGQLLNGYSQNNSEYHVIFYEMCQFILVQAKESKYTV